jgi:predicted nucleotidyltransferase
MNTVNLFDRFLTVLDSLENEKVDYILIGGFAVVLYGMPRMTQDVDIFVKPDEDNIKRLVSALHKVFLDESIHKITLNELIKYPVIRYGSQDGFFIDILIKIGDAFSFDDLDYQILTIQGHRVRTATPETLYKLKKDTIRPSDKTDALFLKEWIDRKLNEQ